MNSGHWSWSFSNDAASVDAPVFVFFTGVRPRVGEQDLAHLDRRVDVEVVVTGDLAQLDAEPCDLGGELLVERLQLRPVDGDADVLHPGEHDDERVLDRAVELGHALLFEARHDRLDEHRDGQCVAPGPDLGADLGAAEVELAARRRVVAAARRTPCSPRGRGRARSEPRPGSAGRRRSRCRARDRSTSMPWASSERISGLVS